MKVGRILVLADSVAADVTCYLPSDDAWRAVLFRHLGGLQALVGEFRRQMRAQLEN